MNGVPEVLDKNGVDAQHCILVSLRLHHVSDSESADVTTLFEVSWIQGVRPHLVENRSTFLPGREAASGGLYLGPGDVLVALVFFTAADNPILNHFFDGLGHIRLWERYVLNQRGTVLSGVFLASNGGLNGEINQDGQQNSQTQTQVP